MHVCTYLQKLYRDKLLLSHPSQDWAQLHSNYMTSHSRVGARFWPGGCVTMAMVCPGLVRNYTERQKKHHFFRATLTKIHRIKINHIQTHISYSSPHEAYLKIQRVAFAKMRKMR